MQYKNDKICFKKLKKLKFRKWPFRNIGPLEFFYKTVYMLCL